MAPIVSPAAAIQAGPDGGLDEGRVGLAARGLHDLADQEPDGLRLAGVIVGDGVGIRGEGLVEEDVERPGIGDLREAARGDDRGGRLARGDMRLQNLTTVRPRDRPVGDRAHDGSELGRAPRRPARYAAFRSFRYSPVTHVATGFAPRSGPAARVASNSRVASGSATRTAASYGTQPERQCDSARAAHSAAPAGPLVSSASQAGSRWSGGRSGSGK